MFQLGSPRNSCVIMKQAQTERDPRTLLLTSEVETVSSNKEAIVKFEFASTLVKIKKIIKENYHLLRIECYLNILLRGI